MRPPYKVIFITLSILFSEYAYSQFDAKIQLIQRFEFRHGYGKLLQEGKEEAAFINQRLRLQTGYNFEKVKIYASIQDVRIWGNTSQIKTTDPHLSLHEGWAEINLDTAWNIKLGRQELVYDQSRFLGNLDWALQGRAHDFLLVKYDRNNLSLHAGMGYNQDAEGLSGTLFKTTNQYKSAQFLRFAKKYQNIEYAFLVWINSKQFIENDSAGTIQNKGIRTTQTFGLPTLKYIISNLSFSGFYYHQTGKDITGKNVNAYDANLQVSYKIELTNDKQSQLKLTPGVELISGTGAIKANENNSYNILYGTNHSYNGYMDMFYSGGRHENSVGLNDFYLRTKYDVSPKLFLSINYHYFKANAKVLRKGISMDRALGHETDLTAGLVINRNTALQFGYSQFFATSTLSKLQGVSDPSEIQNWVYLMLIVRPESMPKFTGLQF